MRIRYSKLATGFNATQASNIRGGRWHARSMRQALRLTAASAVAAVASQPLVEQEALAPARKQAHVLVRRFGPHPTSAAKWISAEEWIAGAAAEWSLVDPVINAVLADDFSKTFDGSTDGALELEELNAPVPILPQRRSAHMNSTLLTVLEVQMPNVNTHTTAEDLANVVSSLVSFLHGRAFMAIRNFPADNLQRLGWASIEKHCRSARLRAYNLCISDGRNPGCWAGQSGLSDDEGRRWSTDGCQTLADYCNAIRDNVPATSPPFGTVHTSPPFETVHTSPPFGTVQGLSRPVSSPAPPSSNSEGYRYEGSFATPPVPAPINATTAALARRFSLFDFPVERCLGLGSEMDLGLYSHAFGQPDFHRGDGMPNLYVHPRHAMSGVHRDAYHSYFFLRLVRGRKLARAWAMDTRASALRFGASWTEMTGRYLEFEMREGDIFFGPSDGFHAVRTTEPSLAFSFNYFPDEAVPTTTFPPLAPVPPPSQSHLSPAPEPGASAASSRRNRQQDRSRACRKAT